MAVEAEAESAGSIRKLNLGCGEDYRHGNQWINVDVVDSVDPDETVNLFEFPWPWDDSSVDHILASHVLEHLPTEQALNECVRILRPGGTLQVIMPIGLDAQADPDHTGDIWTWITPEMYCGKRHWDADVGLELFDRDVTIWPQLPGRWKHLYRRLIERWMRVYGTSRWCFALPATSGEFEVTFKKKL
jgi:SAM-dependent methyltransferase